MATNQVLQKVQSAPGKHTAQTDTVLIELLNGLNDTCADCAYGFATCADHSNVSGHRTLFRKRAQEYRAAQAQLHALVLRLGGMPVPGAQNQGPLHRGWVAPYGTLCGLRDQSIAAECERGESQACERYQQALQHDLSTSVRALIERQMQDLHASLQQIRMLGEPQRIAA